MIPDLDTRLARFEQFCAERDQLRCSYCGTVLSRTRPADPATAYCPGCGWRWGEPTKERPDPSTTSTAEPPATTVDDQKVASLFGLATRLARLEADRLEEEEKFQRHAFSYLRSPHRGHLLPDFHELEKFQREYTSAPWDRPASHPTPWRLDRGLVLRDAHGTALASFTMVKQEVLDVLFRHHVPAETKTPEPTFDELLTQEKEHD